MGVCWTNLQNYRVWIIWRCPTVRFLDYQKVKDVERDKATELFGTLTEPSALASKVCKFFHLISATLLGFLIFLPPYPFSPKIAAEQS